MQVGDTPAIHNVHRRKLLISSRQILPEEEKAGNDRKNSTPAVIPGLDPGIQRKLP